MELSKRSTRIKELIQEEVCLGTFGLVELELKDFDRETKFLESEVESLKKRVTYWVDAVNDMDCDKVTKMLDNEPR